MSKIRGSVDREQLTESRNAIYDSLTDVIMEKTSKKMTRASSRDIFESALKIMFEKAAETGYLRLPGGLGTIKVITRKPTKVHTPYGDVVDVPERQKMRFETGVFQKNLLVTKNDSVEETTGQIENS